MWIGTVLSPNMVYCAVHKYVRTLCDELCHAGCNALGKCAQLSVSPFHIHIYEFHKDSVLSMPWCPLALNDLKLL